MLGCSPLQTPHSWGGRAGPPLSLRAPTGHGQSQGTAGGPRLPGVPRETPLLCHCSVPSEATAGAASQWKSLRHGTGKVQVRMRVGKEIKSRVTFHSQSWELSTSTPQGWGAKGFAAILWVFQAPSRSHGINQVTCTHTGVDQGRSFNLLSAGSPDPACTVSVLFCLGFAFGMGGVWAESQNHCVGRDLQDH